MSIAAKPLSEITQEAIMVLSQNLGIVNTIRFINQFMIGHGNYIEEREELFGKKTLEELVVEIKQTRNDVETGA
ncbi:MAG: hypothetical protein EHM45_16085 [Desulfobacteraceae bacterium]|nr:MAG: hypothetical protein EHM45_16085 [Desulfobacteraceae bacterium]